MADLWIQSKKYDSFFYLYSGILCLLLILPYVIWGDSSIWPIYNVYLLVFGLPHNYLTWATLVPKDAKKDFKWDFIRTALIFCFILCALIPFAKGSNLGDWILSFIAYYSLWHAYRQHHGIAKVYDLVQSKRMNDPTIFEDRKALNLFFGLAAYGVTVWAFTHEHIRYLLSPNDSHELIHPVIPWQIFQIYTVITAMIGIYALKKAVYDRAKRGLFIPWPQLQLMAIALATYIVPYMFIPLEAIPIPVAIATMYHNIQYFGFVWAFESRRSVGMQEAKQVLGLPQQLAARKNWKSYFALGIGYSFLVVALYKILPQGYGLALVYFTGIAHYIVDGYLWKSDINLKLKGVIAQWATRAPIANIRS